MTKSILKNTTQLAPQTKQNKVCSSRLRIENKQNYKNFIEGGLRTKGIFKRSISPNLPLVSVVTACLNSAKTIGQCLNSVFSQSYQNIEYIVIDGGSDDGTVGILEKNQNKIDYFVSEPDSGLYSAMNKGLSLASGDFIIILNSDDWYEDNCVEVLVGEVLKKEVDFVSGLANYVDKNNKRLFTTPVIPFDESTLIRNPLRHETMLVPAWVYNKFGPYDEQYPIIADFHFIIKLYHAGLVHETVPLALINFKNTGVSSTDMTALNNERAILLMEQFPYLTQKDILIISNLQALTKEMASMILVHNRLYPKFHAAFLSFITKKWKFSDEYIKSNQYLAREKDYFRVETFCTNLGGGAGIGTQRRVEALRSIGVDVGVNALILGENKNANKIRPISNGYCEIGFKLLTDRKAYITSTNTPGIHANEMFSSHINVIRMTDLLPVINRADILHFHWVVGMLEYKNFDILSEKPIVWTLADMAAFTGGCHYSQGCEQYVEDCSDCPLIGKSNKALITETFAAKRKAYSQLKRLSVICPSDWLANKAKSSALFKDRPVHMIPNPVPFSYLYPVNKILARVKLGLNPHAKYILFGADDLRNSRKNGIFLISSLEMLQNKYKYEDMDISIMNFGYSSLDLPYPQVRLGVISDKEKMRLVYSAADVFAFPSKEDNSPLTVCESLACGTPVVAFPVGNVPELLVHESNGFIAEYMDVNDFTQGLHWALSADFHDSMRRSFASVSSVRKHNNPLVSARKHVELYQELLSCC